MGHHTLPDGSLVSSSLDIFNPLSLRGVKPGGAPKHRMPMACNIPPPRGRARLHLGAFLGYSHLSQTNTSLFYTLCPYLRTLGKYFLVGHPSLNFSRPIMLNFRVLWTWASRKEVATCWYKSCINPIKPWAGCYIDATPGPWLNRINRRLIPISHNFFSGSSSPKNSKVKHAWLREI